MNRNTVLRGEYLKDTLTAMDMMALVRCRAFTEKRSDASGNRVPPDLLESAAWVNLVWGLGNLLPVIPLDGGRILEEAAVHFRHWKGRELAARISFVFACGLSVLFLALRLWFAAVLFAFLAWNSLRLIQEGGHRSGLFAGDGDNSDARRPWERDSDWWKS